MTKHECSGDSYNRGFYGGYNEAVEDCSEDDDGAFSVDNDEGCSSQVNFCPFCGAKAPKQMALLPIKPTSDFVSVAEYVFRGPIECSEFGSYDGNAPTGNSGAAK